MDRQKGCNKNPIGNQTGNKSANYLRRLSKKEDGAVAIRVFNCDSPIFIGFNMALCYNFLKEF